MPISIRCPSCDRGLRLGDHLLGKRVKCPACGHVFEARPQEEPAVEIDEDAPPPRRRQAATDYESQEGAERDRDEPIDRPRPGKKARRRAREAVLGPAIALMIVGGLGVPIGILNAITVFSGQALPFGPNPQERAQDPAAAQAFDVVARIVASLSIIWGVAVLLGGIQLFRLRSRTSAMVASIFAMLPCSMCCLLGLPFGIWALVVLNRPEVKAGFE